MTVTEFYSNSLVVSLEQFKLLDVKVFADNDGIVRSVEIKYVPDDKKPEQSTSQFVSF